jgi:succinate dehydrogenase / fumarate reductase, membrane anchor subunit
MQYGTPKFRSRLGQVRGLGSAKKGAGGWIADRVAALALIPLTLWFVISVIRLVAGNDEARMQVISSSVNSIMLLLFIQLSLYHGFHGIKVIIEDYVHKESAKFISIILLQFVTIITALAFTFALFVFHLSLFTNA